MAPYSPLQWQSLLIFNYSLITNQSKFFYRDFLKLINFFNFPWIFVTVHFRGDGSTRAGSWSRSPRSTVRGASWSRTQDDSQSYLPRQLFRKIQRNCSYRQDADRSKQSKYIKVSLEYFTISINYLHFLFNCTTTSRCLQRFPFMRMSTYTCIHITYSIVNLSRCRQYPVNDGTFLVLPRYRT